MANVGIYDMTDTWNAGGTTFTAIKMNVTDTASAAGSKLLDIQKGGSSYLELNKSGELGILDKIFHLGDTNTAIRFPAADTISFETSGAEQVRINSTGHFLINKTTPATNLFNGVGGATFQMEGTGNDRRAAIIGNDFGPSFVMGLSKTYQGNGVVSNGNSLGAVFFQGNDGTNFVDAAYIIGAVDGTPSTGDMPGRLLFATTPSGSATPTERMRIDSSGRVGIGVSSPNSKLDLRGVSGDLANIDSQLTTTGAQDTGSRILFTGHNGSYPLNLGRIGYYKENSTIGNEGYYLGLIVRDGSTGVLTERMRITSGGYLRMASGSGGIQFNGDTAAANALDDYEEGTWTPTVEGTTSTSGQTYTFQTGVYTKIGRLVMASFSVDLSNVGTITGSALIAGLPFTVLNSGGAGSGTISYFDNLTGTVSSMMLNANANQTSAFLNHVAGTGATAITNTTAIVGTSTRFDGMFIYHAA